MLMLLSSLACGGTPPAGQPELRRLSADNLTTFHAGFNAHKDKYRVLALLSPT